MTVLVDWFYGDAHAGSRDHPQGYSINLCQPAIPASRRREGTDATWLQRVGRYQVPPFKFISWTLLQCPKNIVYYFDTIVYLDVATFIPVGAE